jgi:small subunit ribosomal protein S17
MAEKKKETKSEKLKDVKLARQPSTRGRTFEGIVIKRFAKRVVIQNERTVQIRKYERFFKKKTKLHARLPEDMDIKVGDIVKIRECRPLSKIIHFIVIKKIKSSTEEINK